MERERAAHVAAAPGQRRSAPATSCGSPGTETLLLLQRSAGNAAVSRLLSSSSRTLARQVPTARPPLVEPPPPRGAQGVPYRARPVPPGAWPIGERSPTEVRKPPSSQTRPRQWGEYQGASTEFEESWNQFWRDVAIKGSPPLATLERGARQPPFVSEGRATVPPGMALPEERLAYMSGRRFHVLDAIEHGVASARTVADLEKVLGAFVGYAPGDPSRTELFPPLPPLGSLTRPTMIFPDNFDPENKRLATFLASLAKRTDLFASSAAPQAVAEMKPAPAVKTKPKTPDPEITLWLPSMKRAHLRLYEALVRERRLLHDWTYERGETAQSSKWDQAMRPSSSRGMYAAVYEEGQRMGLSEARILRPDWSRDERHMPMDVDHMVELQVVPVGERELWNEFDVNYELLDRLSNITSGPVLSQNIMRERVRLAKETGDPLWLLRPIRFTRVQAAAGPGGHRWSKEEIRIGEHLRALKQHQGER